RAALVEALELPAAPRWLRQVHGVEVVRFDGAMRLSDDAAREVSVGVADAAVASEPGVVLAVLTADCLPAVFAARDGSEIGVAHAGWRGLAAGVLERTVAALRSAPG